MLGADANPLVSGEQNGQLGVLHRCAPPTCTGPDTFTVVDANAQVGEFNSITLGVDGLGIVSYYDRSNQGLKVAHCSNVACTSADVHTLDAGPAGTISSVTIGQDDLPVISYADERQGGHLEVAHCTHDECSDATHILGERGRNGYGAGDIDHRGSWFAGLPADQLPGR